MDDKIRIVSEQFEKEETGELVEGVSIIIDGVLRQGLDLFLQKFSEYDSYPDIMQDILLTGICDFMNKHKDITAQLLESIESN